MCNRRASTINEKSSYSIMINARVNAYKLIFWLFMANVIKYRSCWCWYGACVYVYSMSGLEVERQKEIAAFVLYRWIIQVFRCVSDVKHKIQLFINRSATIHYIVDAHSRHSVWVTVMQMGNISLKWTFKHFHQQ